MPQIKLGPIKFGLPSGAEKKSAFEEQVTRVTKDIYEQNVELATRNRTLSVLRQMYEIINTSLEVEEVAQKLIEAIVTEMQFRSGFIMLLDKQIRSLKVIAAPQVSSVIKVAGHLNKPLNKLWISLEHKDNYCVSSLLFRQRKMTNFLSDIWTPLIDEKTADAIQKELNILTSYIFPLLFAGEALGVLVLGMDKHVGDLTRVEREVMRELIDVVGIAVERAQIYADLRKANEKLKVLDKLKDEFVSIASHELRTPMTAIKSYLWMLVNDKADGDSGKAKEYLDRAYISTERLINLVNDMLDVSRIESGRIRLESSTFDVVKTTREVCEELRPKAVEKKISLLLREPEDLTLVFADSGKTRQVIINLIGNGLKFTPEGGEVKVYLEKKGNFISLYVCDNGPGIAKEDQAELFQKFSRIEKGLTTVAQNSGTGLGLYICRQMVEMMGGKIWVESEAGKGSVFGFSLPIKRPAIN